MKNKRFISFIKDQDICFARPDSDSIWELAASLSLDDFLIDYNIPELFSGRIPSGLIDLLVVPDYWIGNVSYRFQTKKRSVIEEFLERKLRSEHPDLPEIGNFFEYELCTLGQGDQWLRAYFLQEPKFYQLYYQLAAHGIEPNYITSPAFLWQYKLKKSIPDFHLGNKGFIHLLPGECSLYFFSRGSFVFARSIALAGSHRESSEIFDLLTFEINQSRYLFTQQAKDNLDRFYLLSSDERDSATLSDRLGIKVEAVNFSAPVPAMSVENEIGFSPVGFFDASELAPRGRFLSFSHILQKKTGRWQPVLKAGVITGVLILSLMAIEAVYLTRSSRFQVKMGNSPVVSDPGQTIQLFSEAVDELIMEGERPSLENIILKIVQSLPPNARIDEMKINPDLAGKVEFKGVITASDPAGFKDTLSTFLTDLKKNTLQAASVSIRDVDVKVMKGKTEKGFKEYSIEFSFYLS